MLRDIGKLSCKTYDQLTPGKEFWKIIVTSCCVRRKDKVMHFNRTKSIREGTEKKKAGRIQRKERKKSDIRQ